MSDTKITFSTTPDGAENLKGCHLRLVHSEPINRWQAFKYRSARSWWFRWFVRRWPIKYRSWTESAAILDVSEDGTALTHGPLTEDKDEH